MYPVYMKYLLLINLLILILINLKFGNSLNNSGREPPQEYASFFGSECDVYFQRRCRLNFFLPYGPMLTKTKKIGKISKIKILKNKKNCLEIWWIGICPKNLALIHSVVSKKTMSTDDDGRQWMTDARVTTVALLCSSTKQS